MKSLLTTLCAALFATSAGAQFMSMYEGASFSKMSPNADWLIENNQGTMNILNRSTGNTWSIEDADGLKLYSPGLGQCATDEGIIVGMAADNAVMWHRGRWTNLPQPTGIGTTFNMANAITPDAHRIVGMLGHDGASLAGNGMMCYPVVWTLNAEGNYECEALPCPTKDFTRSTPQYITAVDISDDGKTVIGQIRDASGFYLIPIVYRESAEGTWTYQVVGEDLIYDTSRIDELPTVTAEPVMPDARDFMSEEERAKYDEDMALYEEAKQNYEDGVIDEEPEYPQLVNYITQSDSIAKYNAAARKYNAQIEAYVKSYNAYLNKLAELTTGYSFLQNSVCLSRDGRYFGASVQHTSGNTYPGYFDLEADSVFFERRSDNSSIITGMLNDGTVLAAAPVVELTRSTFVILPGKEREETTFEKFLATRSTSAATWLRQNNAYSFQITDTDADNNTVIVGEVTDSLVSGTVHCNGDGTVFVSYYTDYYSDTENTPTRSYVINLNTESAIHAAQTDASALRATFDGTTLRLSDEVSRATLYDMSGRAIAESANGTSLRLHPTSGTYLVKMQGRNGATATQKVILK